MHTAGIEAWRGDWAGRQGNRDGRVSQGRDHIGKEGTGEGRHGG